MGTLNETDYVAFIGIDWANAKHDVCIQGAGSEQREFAVIAHQVERIEEWAQAMKQRFGSPYRGGSGINQRTDCVCPAEIRFLCDLSDQSHHPGQVSRSIHTESSER